VVRLVRDAGLGLAEVNEIRRAANQARKTGQAPEEFIAANPAVAPIVNLIIQQGRGRDWFVMLLMVLAIIVPYLQNAEYHTEEERQRAALRPATTQVLSESALSAIERELGARVRAEQAQHFGSPAIRQHTKTTRKRRPPKRHGKTKRKRHR
jgi:hypothetical protein